MKNIIHQQNNLPGQIPVMVLPNTLLFPNSLLPLYIFEERYREMLAHCLERSRMFCIAQVKPGLSDDYGLVVPEAVGSWMVDEINSRTSALGTVSSISIIEYKSIPYKDA